MDALLLQIPSRRCPEKIYRTAIGPHRGVNNLPSTTRFNSEWRPMMTYSTNRSIRAAYAVPTSTPVTRSTREAEIALVSALEGCFRGARSTAEQRATIEEAQVRLEGFGGATLNSGLDSLHGLWRLLYTTAPDVLGLLKAPDALPLPLLEIGDIFQNFECRGEGEGGKVQNIVRWSVSGLTEAEGVTLTVGASFRVSSGRSIALSFQNASIGDLRISGGLEGLIAPSLLPRGQLPMAILQFLRQAEFLVPLTTPSAGPLGGAPYQLTYLSHTLLVGRALAPAGSFVFVREE